jgi:hypothetical protein
LRKTLAATLTGILLFAALGMNAALAQTNDARAQKARAKVEKIKAGSKTKVEVILRDHTKLRGRISHVGTDDFTLTDSKTGASQTVAFTDVEKVSKGGSGLTLGTWILIASGAAAAITLGAVFHSIRCNESGC